MGRPEKLSESKLLKFSPRQMDLMQDRLDKANIVLRNSNTPAAYRRLKLTLSKFIRACIFPNEYDKYERAIKLSRNIGEIDV